MPSTRSRAPLKTGSSAPSNASVSNGDDTSERPTKRPRTEELKAVVLNNAKEDIVASEHAEDEENDQVFEVSKDPSRAADLYLDTVCALIVQGCGDPHFGYRSIEQPWTLTLRKSAQCVCLTLTYTGVSYVASIFKAGARRPMPTHTASMRTIMSSLI